MMDDPDRTTTLTVNCTQADLEALEQVAEEMCETLRLAFPAVPSGLTREGAAIALIRAGIKAHGRA